jgi:hypothetical protein
MAQLFGRQWTRGSLRRYAALEQLAGVRRFELQEGFERGVEVCEVSTGGGLCFGVCPSRGLDIVWAEHNGRPLCWRGDNGVVHPAFYEEGNFGWLRGFAGGLLTTCGLSSFGPPCEDEGEFYGLHDRISFAPARGVAVQTVWLDEETCEFSVSGTLRQTRLFGPNLRLERRISARLGENVLRVHDHVFNDGFEAAPMVVLYHCNFGFPLVDERARVEVPASRTIPRDACALEGLAGWAEFELPQAGRAEQVFFHDVRPDDEGFARVGIVNQALNMGVHLRFQTAQLPHLTQWKCLRAGAYVCGLEPSNAPLASRAQLRERGELPLLEPGESREFNLEFSVVELEDRGETQLSSRATSFEAGQIFNCVSV